MLIQVAAMQASSTSHSGTTSAGIAGLILAALAAGAAATAASDLLPSLLPWLRNRRSRTAEAAPSKTLEDRLDELSKSMQDSARLVEQISAELDARATTVKRLQEDAKAAEALAGLHKEQVEAVRRMMDAELEGNARRIRRDTIIIGFGSFVAGGAVSFVITLFVHPLH
jgi:hypothetical protein